MTEPTNPSMIRMYCDGELSPADQTALKAQMEADPQLRRQVEFECRLRKHIAALMELEATGQGVPPALRAAIHADLQIPEIDSLAGQSAAIAGQTKASGFWPAKFSWLAVAACLALVAGAVLIGIYGRTIDEVDPPTAADLVAQAAAFADQNHGKGEWPIPTETEAEDSLTDWLGSSVTVYDLDHLGYKFIGAGQCDMPVPVRSARLVYQKLNKSSPEGQNPMVTIFMVPEGKNCGDRLCEGLAPGKWRLAPADEAGYKHKVMQSTDGQFVFFLVCCNQDDTEAVGDRVAGQFGK